MSFKLFTRTYATSDKPDKAIIAIHGWKGDEYVFEQVAKLINLENSEWFFPRAPYKIDSGNLSLECHSIIHFGLSFK